VPPPAEHPGSPGGTASGGGAEARFFGSGSGGGPAGAAGPAASTGLSDGGARSGPPLSPAPPGPAPAHAAAPPGPARLPTPPGPAGPGGPPGLLPGGAVHALFDLQAPAVGPFPSDIFTVADLSQNTSRRVNLPLPDPTTNPSDYQDTLALNTLDGFNLQPRLSVSFDGPIDVGTVTSQDEFLISLGDTIIPGDTGGQVVGINQVVWDPLTDALHVQSDQLLDQHTRYALIVTQGIHGLSGGPVQASPEFKAFVQDGTGEYHAAIVQAIQAAVDHGVPAPAIVDASVFTTESATAVLEKIRDQLHAATPAPADFNLGPNGQRTVFDLDQMAGLTFNQQTTTDGPLEPAPVNLDLLRDVPGAVGQVAFGRYLSPDYEVHPGEYIPPVATLTGTPVVQGYSEIYFNLFLPSGPKPAGGWPVAIWGHGGGGNKQGSGNTAPLMIAASLAAHGIATVAINAVGHGYGPLGTLTVSQAGAALTFPAGGRGIDQNGDHVIDKGEGFWAAPPYDLLFQNRDGLRQTVADLMQLVRVIEVGMDVGGDGVPDLDPSRIYYAGHSMGGAYGTMFLAVEPDVRAGVLNAAPARLSETYRLSTYSGVPVRNGIGNALAARVPPLLNTPGVTAIEGVPVSAPFFNENLPLRDGVPFTVSLADGTQAVIQAPVINTVPGATAIQEALDREQWAMMAGDPVAYAPHLRKDPLPGVPAKSVIYQLDKGDQTAPNPGTTALLRAGDLADRVTYYRHDLAYAANPALPKNPHSIIGMITDPAARPIALGYQEQIGTFLASDGTEVIHPEPAKYFEVPIQGPLPEHLSFIP
jgi:hypothetical protein